MCVKVKNLLFLYLFLHINLILNAQNLYFNSYTTREGLSQNSVYSIAQTKEGFMWFGTQHGLNRFDGRKIKKIEFRPFDVKKGKSYSQMITAMHLDAHGNFWIGTTSEILLFDKYTNVIYEPSFFYPNLKFEKSNWVESIEHDNSDHLWIKTRNRLYMYDVKNKCMNDIMDTTFVFNTVAMSKTFDGTKIYFATATTLGFSDGKQIRMLDEDIFKNNKDLKIKNIIALENIIWIIANDNSMWKYDISGSHRLMRFQEIFKGNTPMIDPVLLHRSDAHTLWVGSRSEGVMIINFKPNEVKKSANTFHQNGLVKQFVLSLFTDAQHNTWIGLSGGGVAKYDINNTKFGLWRNEPILGAEQSDNMIMSMYTDNNEDFYCGTLFGGLMHTNVTTNVTKYFIPPLTTFNKTDAMNIYTIVKGKGDLLWLATWGGLCSFDKKTEHMNIYNDGDFKTTHLATLTNLKNKNKLLVGGYVMGLRFFNLSTNKWEPCPDPEKILIKKDLRPRYIQQTSDSTVLIATETNNLVQYNFENGSFTFFTEFMDKSNMAAHFFIDENFWWIGTNDGLLQVDAHNQCIIKVWDKNSGLPDNVIYSVLPDDRGHIWVGTNQGLTAINTETGVCQKFTENDGLQSMEFNTAACLKDAFGNLWFGGINGFNKVPSVFNENNAAAPSPLITSIHVMNEVLKSDTLSCYIHKLSLPPSQNFINFEFQCPYYSQTENIVYKYKLSPVDTGWVYSGTRNFVNYTQLPPGKYTFEVKAANTNLIWSAKAAMITFSIDVPWYKTWWFYAIVAVSFLFFIVRMYLQRLSALKKDAEIKHQIAQTEMAALKAQMNPHFIFNCINSIDAYIQCNDKYLASFYLNKFAKLIRNTLESSKHNLVPFQKDLETIKLYVEMEEMRNESKFKTKYYIDTSIENLDIKIPPLIVQPYIENAILHGLRNRDGNEGLLSISISKNEDYLYYEITDNGIGRVASRNISINKLPSYGMQLSEDRVRLFNDDANNNIEILDNYTSDGKASGTTIKLKLKIN
jgi:ligand-binding sensor domain-containing protein